MRRHSFNSDSARRALGVAGIVGFVALALCSDANVLTRFHIMNTAKAENSLIGASSRKASGLRDFAARISLFTRRRRRHA